MRYSFHDGCSVCTTPLITREDPEHTSAYNRHVTMHASGDWFHITAKGQVRGEDSQVRQEVVAVRSLLAPSSRNHRILAEDGPASSIQRPRGLPQEEAAGGEGQSTVLAVGDLGTTGG